MRNVSAAVVLVAVTLLGLLWQEQLLDANILLGLAVIFALAVIGLIMVFATASGASWTAGLGTLFFAASIADSTLVYWVIREAFLEYALLLGWMTLGLLYCATRSAVSDVRPYGEPMQLENIMPVPKPAPRSARKTRKPRTSRKKRR
ncbi:hypothetical protein HY493_00080 [Candidatus Woesearchaeota archaeon]|nr:hypothetical protein [Candidatus Woesearchaeota archaeon]